MYGIVDAGLVYQSSQTSLGSTSAQSEVIDRWFSDDVEFAKLHRQSAGTMILVGMQDAVLVRHISLVLRRAIPHSELVEVAEEGHAMMYRFPVRLGQKINAFLKG
jgi:pimeloyl-ACP methyl ester carboxylesterase